MVSEKEKREQALKVINTIHNCIEDAGEEGIPSGHLYAMLMGFGMTLDSYNAVISYLKKAGKITDSGHLLKVIKKED
jgi:hypothetical protein